MTFKIGFYRLRSGPIFNEFTLLLRTSSMTLCIPAKVLIHMWSYDFYDMTLSTGKQRRHMINIYFNNKTRP